MKTAAPISVDEYLRTTYDPDCDYVDGEVIERNVGERSHGELQFELARLFRVTHRLDWHTHAFIEQRLQESETRFRIPDVCVYLGEKPKEQVLHTPPFICIEILCHPRIGYRGCNRGSTITWNSESPTCG